MNKLHSYVNIDSEDSRTPCRPPRLDLSNSWFKGHSLENDEIDLLSECSTPVSYVPGRFLQLSDLSPDISNGLKIWPVSNGSSPSEMDMMSQSVGHTRQSIEESYFNNQDLRKSPRLSSNSSRLIITVAVCLVVAFTALGGLAAII